MEDGRAKGLPAIWDGRPAAISLTPDVDGTPVPNFENLQFEDSYVKDCPIDVKT